MRTTPDEQLIAQLELLFYEVARDPQMGWPCHEVNRIKSCYKYYIEDSNKAETEAERIKWSCWAAWCEDIIRQFVLHRDYDRARMDCKLSKYTQNKLCLGYNDE